MILTADYIQPKGEFMTKKTLLIESTHTEMQRERERRRKILEKCMKQ